MFLVEKEIASDRAEFVKRDTCQVRPMARCPSVPVRLFIHLYTITITFVLLPRRLLPVLAI